MLYAAFCYHSVLVDRVVKICIKSTVIPLTPTLMGMINYAQLVVFFGSLNDIFGRFIEISSDVR